jgi:hypothetical protein
LLLNARGIVADAASRPPPAPAPIPQGLVGGQEGAVLRRPARPGALAGVPWQILVEQRGGRFLQVGQMKRRPTQSDLELAFMNASAAKSPLTGAVRSAKSLLDRVRGGGGDGGA